MIKFSPIKNSTATKIYRHHPRPHYPLPPTPAQMLEMLPQQLLMLNTATAAADMAGEIPAATGVFIGLGLDCNTGHFYVRWQQPEDSVQWPALTYGRTLGALGSVVASRIARTFACHRPAFTISSDASSGIKALELARTALHAKKSTPPSSVQLTLLATQSTSTPAAPTYKATRRSLRPRPQPLPAAQRDGNTILAILGQQHHLHQYLYYRHNRQHRHPHRALRIRTRTARIALRHHARRPRQKHTS